MKIETDILALKLNPSSLDKLLYTAIHDNEAMPRWCSKIGIGAVPIDKLYSQWLSDGNYIEISFISGDPSVRLSNTSLFQGIKLFIATNSMQIDRATFNDILANMDGMHADCIVQYALFGDMKF